MHEETRTLATMDLLTVPADPDLSDVRAMVLSAIGSARGDSLTAQALATRFGLPISSVGAVLGSLGASGLIVAADDGYAIASIDD
jgi:DNA-binding GntR family transcriptional regulator